MSRPLLLASLSLGACAAPAPTPGPTGGAADAGPAALPATAWLDAEGRQVFHRGMNVSNEAKWRPDHVSGLSDAELDLLVTQGVTLARYLVFWMAVEPEEGVYDAAYLARVRDDVARLTARGLAVVVDMHQDLYGEGFGGDGAPAWTCDAALYERYDPPEGPWFTGYLTPEVQACFDRFWASEALQAAYAAAWAQVVAAVADDPGVVGFEVMNEPFWGSAANAARLETELLPPFYARVAAELPDDRYTVVEPSVGINISQESDLDLPPGPRWLFAPHDYPAYAEAGTGWDGDFAVEAAALDAMVDEAEARGLPFLLGEYGIFSDLGNEADYVRRVLDTVAARGGGTAYWSYEHGGTWQPLTAEGAPGPGLAGFDRPFVFRTPGPLTREGTAPLRFSVAPGPVDAPLVVVVPGSCTPTAVPPGDWDPGRRALSWPAPTEEQAYEVRGCD